ncbi:aconitase family protein [Sphingomonadaceae bacterium G21617-S1]|nr:aconitase family protein [Sphingomonadaceae bacterium G21617-S1]
MGMTMTSKILARAAGRAAVAPGDAVIADVHMLSAADAGLFIDLLRQKNLKLWDSRRVLFCFDHFFADWMPIGATREHPKIRSFAQEQGIPPENIYDLGRNGISHQIPVEAGWALPGTVSLGADTQAATMGAANCFSIPTLAGTTSVAITGRLWQLVPECLRITFSGRLRPGVLGKDIVYRLMQDLGQSAAGRVIEIDGQGVAELSIDIRMAISNGAVQMGALAIIFPCDERLEAYLKGRARTAYQSVSADPDAPYVIEREYDLSEFDWLVAGPHEIDLIRSLPAVEGVEVTAAYIGSCSSGRLEDLVAAADVLRGRTIHPNVRLAVTPISAEVMREAEREGLLRVFLDAGAIVTNPGCGACYHGNMSPLKLGEGERCVSASVETLRGRMGAESAEIYLTSAAVVAASALAGHIVGPVRDS